MKKDNKLLKEIAENKRIYAEMVKRTRENTYEINIIEDFSKLPPKLPESAKLKIYSWNLKTLEGISSDLSNLEELEIFSKQIQDLRGLPEKLPSLQRLKIKSFCDYRRPEDIDVKKFNSFKGIPQKLPELKTITLDHVELQNFDHLPLSLPQLEEIKCANQPLSNFLGFPQDIPSFKCLDLEFCDIYSFEGFPQPEPESELNLNPSFSIRFENSRVHNLTGLKHSWFKYIVKKLFNYAGSGKNYYYAEIDNSINRYREIFKLSSKGMELLVNCIQWDVFNQYFPSFQMTGHLDEADRFPEWNNRDENEWNNRFRDYPEKWIDGYGISDRLFIDENLNLLYELEKNEKKIKGK